MSCNAFRPPKIPMDTLMNAAIKLHYFACMPDRIDSFIVVKMSGREMSQRKKKGKQSTRPCFG